MAVKAVISSEGSDIKDSDFPLLMVRARDGLIVKMFYRSYGQEFAYGFPLNALEVESFSQFHCTWKLADFTKFAGEITLSNLEEA